MTRARKELVSLDATPYYHCISRCVRRAFLCGEDHYSGKSYEHRRGWIVSRIKQLSSAFAIDIAAYAVMSNHYHAVMRVDAEKAKTWTTDEVISRWCLLFNCPSLIQRYRDGSQHTAAELEIVHAVVEEWRGRLCSISWYMRCMNENIARLANREDHCSGRFWEGRFKSQALLDEVAVLACMAYVDLNPIRAGMADSPESSDFTSIQERLGITPSVPESPKPNKQLTSEAPLLAFRNMTSCDDARAAIPFCFVDYLELVEWTGRAIRADKRDHIPEHIPPLLQRLNIDTKQWINASAHLERDFYRAIGPIEKLNQLCEKLQKRWLHGTAACTALYGLTLPAL